ncbi:MAG: hypothetical protein HQ592_00835 [Planctomycetes bacterium]|nr:hypothetical protein [Planctomycetota bacterium]
MRKGFCTETAALLFCFAIIVTCRNGLAGEVNAGLQQRITDLENELREVKQAIGREPAAAQGRLPVWSTLDVQFSGYIKLDASYDSTDMNTGNYATWAESETGNQNDNMFNMTANQTRLRLVFKGPEVAGAQSSGKVETDFYGNGAGENKAGILVRHAFIKLDWPDSDCSLIAGQTSDLASPLAPETLNYTVFWNVGNIGYRRPQLRLTKGISISEGSRLKLEGAAFRSIGRAAPGLAATDDSGEDAGYPGGAARVSVAIRRPGGEDFVVGVSGHIAGEEAGNSSKHYKSWFVGLDMTAPINKALSLTGEIFNGQNLNQYFGGIGQGVNTATLKEIKTWGGWVGLKIKPGSLPQWRFNINAGLEDVDSGDLSVAVAPAAPQRKYNRAVSVNAIRSFGKHLEVGLELTDWLTKYKGAASGDGYRAQASLIYTF